MNSIDVKNQTLGAALGSLLLVGIFVFICLSSTGAFNEKSTQPADGFTIGSYNVILDVKEDNKVEVTEQPTIVFTELGHHGIYKFIPYWLEYTPKTGKKIKRKSNIINLRTESDPYQIDEVNGKARIKIGSATTTLPLGEKEYTIKYTYDMGKDPYRGYDEFIFHVYGDFWGTEISNPSLEINMPKVIEGCTVHFFADKYRQNDITNTVDYQIEGKQLIAKVNMELEESLTVDIELPDGYFIGGSNNYSNHNLLLILIIIVLTTITFIIWLLYGKDYKKGIETVEFYPPDNLSAAEIGYVFNDQQPIKKLTIALIIELAAKGYIKIDETEQDGLVMTDLLEKPTLSVANDLKDKVQIDFELLKGDPNLLTAEEQTTFNSYKPDTQNMVHIFGDAAINANELIKKFAEKGFIKITRNDIDNPPEHLNGEQEEYNKNLQEYNDKASKLEPLNSYEQLIYDKLFETSHTVILKNHDTFYKVFKEIEDKINTEFKEKIFEKNSLRALTYCRLTNIAIPFLAFIAFYIVKDLGPEYYFLYYVSFACIVLNVILSLIIIRRTEYGENLKAKINGFKNFLETAEKSTLEGLVEKNPNYFYNILPYTYVLGVSKKWISKFEDIPVPEPPGNFNFSDSNYDRINDNFSYPISSSSGLGSGSCSSCGGGCSSCGGGCSSCGGGGSW